MRRIVSWMILTLLLAGTLALAFNVGLVHAQYETVYINSDGSVSPSSAPVSTVDNITYTFTGSMTYPTYDGIVVERSNIVIDGSGYTVQGNQSIFPTPSIGGNGVTLTGVSNVTVKNVNVMSFDVGICLFDSNNSVISDSNATGNTDCGINLVSCSSDTVSGNNITNNFDGVILNSSSDNSISGNTITTATNYGGTGIWLTSSSSSNSINGNYIANNYDGFTVDNSSDNNSISGNTITNNEDGFDILYSPSNNEIIGNNITANHVYGIYLGSSSGNSIIGNNITANNDCGIGDFSSNYTIISENNITNNGDGIDLDSSGAEIIGNNITGNDNFYGLSFGNSASNNTIYHNNFIGNTVEVSTYESNVWDEGYPYGGNYWSNYNGTDLYSGPYQNITGSDGIGDTPYVISPNNVDHYPLMKPYAGLTTFQAAQTVYIESDGSVTPSNAPISTVDNVTYTFSSNISFPTYNGIVVERSNTVIDGKGFTVEDPLFVVENGYTIEVPYGSLDQSVGLGLRDASNVTVENANVRGFDVGICLFDSNNDVIDCNNVTVNGDGIYLNSSSNNIVSGNYVAANWNGIGIDFSSNNTVSRNNVTESLYGIETWFSNNNTVNCNEATASTYYGIFLDFSSNNIVNGNNATANSDCGIWLGSSSNNTVNGNIATSNSGVAVGIFLDSSSNNTVSSNNVTANAIVGIGLDYSSNNTVSGNDVTANGEGIYLQSSSNNTMYHNNFVGNVAQASFVSICVGNVWDDGYPSGGNYWSDYNGTDSYHGTYQNVTGSDGLGDTPYIIDSNNTDNYPLMQPFGPSSTPTGYLVAAITTKCTWVYQGQTINVSVTANNFGHSSENMWVTLYYDIAANMSIGAYPVRLETGRSCLLTFVWNTADVPCGTYTLTAVATIPTGSSVFSDGNITVRLMGDVNGDGRVDLRDIALVARAFGSTPGSPNWNPAADLNGDGIVNMQDIALVARHFGSHT